MRTHLEIGNTMVMVQQFAFHVIILTLWFIYAVASTRVRTTAQPGCNSTCGYVCLIPYPFGINNPKCYLNIWFEIECRYTSEGEKPYLKYLNLEVTSINLDGTVEIKSPIYHWNCQNNKVKAAAVNLSGSPFRYSQDNRFVAVGCNTLAFLRSEGTDVGGCVSICSHNEQINDNFNINGCHGRYCCKTSLPNHLSEYSATVKYLKNKSTSDKCSFAFIVSDYWTPFQDLDYYYNNYNYMRAQRIRELKNMDYVPAVLEWEILNDMLINSTMQLPSDSRCYDSNVTSSHNTTSSGRRCRCLIGSDGNPYIAGGCISRPALSVKIPVKKWAIVGVFSSLGSIIFLLGLWFLYKAIRKRVIKKRRQNFFKKNGGLLLQKRMSTGEVNVDKTILFSLKDLEKATDHFNKNRVLGKGGQGTVYKGMLVDGNIVAVKKFKVEGNIEEFINEFVILSQINNRNVVKLLGCCLETEIPLLVYEFIPNGNLFQYLHEQNEDIPMTWEMRLRIATEIAGALFYLHSVASQPIYHRDIKSTNILLDEKYRAKIADFGASRIISIEATHLTTVVQGTFGYLDPEYFHTSQFTEKSDVYSFGVVLAELITGQRPISSIRSAETKSLASYFVQCVEENNLFDIIDKRMMKEAEKKHIIAVANLANRCLELNGRKRPTMKEVTLELEGIKKLVKKSSTEQNHEDIELAEIEDGQAWAEYSTSNSLPALSSEKNSSDSEVIPIVALK